MKKKYITKVSFSILASLCSLADLKAQHPTENGQFAPIAGIDNFVYAFMAETNVPGLSLAITRNEKIVYLKGYGYADREGNEKITPASLFRIASISKPLTSVAIMKLVEEKKLSLDDKVFGPKGLLKTTYGKQPYKKEITDITVRHLLQHLAGGWGNKRNDPMFTDPARPQAELISFTLDSFSLEHAPGTNYDYSNFGYCVLGRIIEKITGRHYEDYVKTTILQPCGITDMLVGGNRLEDRKNNEVKYYGRGNEDPYKYNIERMDSHGGWLATAGDLVKLLAHVDGGTNVKDILSLALLFVLQRPPVSQQPIACLRLGS